MKSARDRLRSWRESRKLAQHELAKELDISQQLLSGLETGDRNPGLLVAFRIQEVTGIPADLWTKTMM